jgi:hypothetical protein
MAASAALISVTRVPRPPTIEYESGPSNARITAFFAKASIRAAHWQATEKIPQSRVYLTSMYGAKGVAAGGASLFFLILAMPAVAGTREAPPNYTFKVDVAMAMRHFPWLHFHVQGVGVYETGVSYIVHFTTLPWFVPKSRHDADLSMIDPLMWPKRYLFSQTGEQNGDTIFELHAIDDAGLRNATVAIGPGGLARHIEATYSDGTTIDTQVSNSNVDGFLLPVSMKADINEPHMALSASADFKDYDFNSQAKSNTMSR